MSASNGERIELLRELLTSCLKHHQTPAELVERLEASTVAWEASENAALGYAHIEGDPKNEDNVFAAERFEEAAMMYLVAAKMLRKGGA
jgi:hypothetical protein